MLIFDSYVAMANKFQIAIIKLNVTEGENKTSNLIDATSQEVICLLNTLAKEM